MAAAVQQMPRCPGRPLCTVPVNRPSDLSEGDHILYRTNGDEYRPTYQSALIEKNLSEGKFRFIVYAPKGIERRVQNFLQFKSLHRVKYVGGHSNEEAIEGAKKRIGEKYYHGLFNNSHHFVTFAKTGLEYSLTELVYGLQEPWKDDYELDPVLMVSQVETIEDIKPADHIMEDSDHHWLVKSIDKAKSSFTGFTCRGEKVIEDDVSLKPKISKFYCIEYPPNGFNPDDVLQKARAKLKTKSEWDGSDKFITEMKLGEAYAFDERCLLDSNCKPESCTLVRGNIVLDLGDHLIVKREGDYRSVIIKSIIDADMIVCMPDIVNSEEPYGYLSISGQSEVHRVNYNEHLPSRDILLRAESKIGQEILQSHQQDTTQFVTWAMTGRKFPIDAKELITKQKLKLVRPTFYKRIISGSEIQEGDHLFIPKTGYRWHFLVTERHATQKKFKVAYYLRGKYQESTETVDPSEQKVYKVIYSEEFAPEVVIHRARQKISSEIHVDAWARTEFMSWAKTGSEDGMEIDLMTNSSLPYSKSSIACFQQLSIGDYLVVDEGKMTPYHHCPVLEVKSPEKCTVMEVWNRRIKQSDIQLNKEEWYYKLNYTMGADVCRTTANHQFNS